MHHFKKILLVVMLFFTNQNFIFAQAESTDIIKSRFINWIDNFNKKDLEKLLSIYSEDYSGYYSGHPDQNLKTIGEQNENIFNNKYLSVKLSAQVVEIEVSDNLAFVRMILTWSIRPTNIKTPQVLRDKGIQVWKKQGNDWKIFRSITYPLPASK